MAHEALTQSTDIPLNSWAYPIIDEWDVRHETGIFTTIKPIPRKYISENIPTAQTGNRADQYDAQFMILETREYQDSVKENKKPVWNTLFRYPSDFFSYNNEDFDLHVSPIIVLGGGKDNAVDEILFENYRGLEVRGTIDQKVSFYTMLTENQARYPHYVKNVTDSTLGVPYEGFWKQYRDTGVDFLRARAYIDFNVSKHIGLQFGYGKHFIGDGRRSLILSDIGNNYPYLRINTRVWKIQYTNLFAQLIGETYGGSFGLLGSRPFTRKFLANHHLSIQVLPNLTLGLFESVIYGDSTNSARVEYFNPMIFYRALEQQDGSSDNVILGMDFKWNLWNRFSLYGQFVVDELIIKEAINRTGWWGNKQAFQLGLKYFDVFGIKNLNGQVEWNQVRPYVYSHETNFTSYSHYNMALAHPLGANFREVLFSVNFRPIPKVCVQGDLLLAQYGNDINGLSYGRDLLKPYLPENRPGDYGNNLLQGNKTDLVLVRGQITYQVYHNVLMEVGVTRRNESPELTTKTTSTIYSMSVRWNFPYRNYLF